MWALYKLKPGVPTCLSPGAGKAGGGSGMMISSPRATSNLPVVQAASAPPKPAAVNGTGAGKCLCLDYGLKTITLYELSFV